MDVIDGMLTSLESDDNTAEMTLTSSSVIINEVERSGVETEQPDITGRRRAEPLRRHRLCFVDRRDRGDHHRRCDLTLAAEYALLQQGLEPILY